MYVHSLVMIASVRNAGWCAPFECDEAASHAVGFAIPVDRSGLPQESYICETVKGLGSDQQTNVTHSLTKIGADAFRLSIRDQHIWFAIRPSSKKNDRLPYIGKLKHPDFDSLLVEIEPEDQAALDRLYEATGEFIIGCDPFRHYQGIEETHARGEPANGEPANGEPCEYVSLWSFAKGDLARASRLLNFICANDFSDVLITKRDYRRIQAAFKKDPDVYYSWDIHSEHAGQIAKSLLVPVTGLRTFLRQGGFDPDAAKKPRRSKRDDWIRKWKQVG